MTVLATLGRNARVLGNRPALRFEDGCWTYGELWDRVLRAATALRAEGVRDDDSIAVLGGNSESYLAAYFGAMLSGAMVVPLSTRSSVAGLEAQLEHVGSRGVIVTDPALLETVETTGVQRWSIDELDENPSSEPRLPSRSSSALCIMTTGTTDQPKGVVHSHAGLAHASGQVAETLPYRPGDTSVCFLPFFASIPEQALPVLLTGGTLHIVRRFDVDEIVRVCAEAQSFHAVPTIVGRLLTAGNHDRLRNLNWMAFASEPMPQVLLEHWWSEFPSVEAHQFYGMSELLPISYASPETMRRSRGTVGSPFPTSSISVVDERLEPVPPGMTGEVVCQSPARMVEYLRAPELTAQSLTPSGGMRTGDLGFLDDDGLLHLTGRMKDVIISGGLNIAAGDIERVAARFPGVGSVAAIAAPSERWGETPVLIVVPLPGTVVNLHELLEHCATALADYRSPTAAALLPELPTSGIGKADKPLLRTWLSDGRFALTASGDRNGDSNMTEPGLSEAGDMEGL